MTLFGRCFHLIVVILVHVFSAIMAVDECCEHLKFKANGPSLKTQKSVIGEYFQTPLISNNNYTAYTQKNGSHTIMFDLRHGWRIYIGYLNGTKRQQHSNGQVRKICKLSCPEYCKNTKFPIIGKHGEYTRWEFYDGHDEDNEWHFDESMRIECIITKPLTLTAVEGSIGGIIGIAVLIAVLYCIITRIRMCLKQRQSHPDLKRQTSQFYSMGENPTLQWI